MMVMWWTAHASSIPVTVNANRPRSCEWLERPIVFFVHDQRTPISLERKRPALTALRDLDGYD